MTSPLFLGLGGIFGDRVFRNSVRIHALGDNHANVSGDSQPKSIGHVLHAVQPRALASDLERNILTLGGHW